MTWQLTAQSNKFTVSKRHFSFTICISKANPNLLLLLLWDSCIHCEPINIPQSPIIAVCQHSHHQPPIKMPIFAEIPVEVLIDNFLPNLPVAAILRLTRTNKVYDRCISQQELVFDQCRSSSPQSAQMIRFGNEDSRAISTFRAQRQPASAAGSSSIVVYSTLEVTTNLSIHSQLNNLDVRDASLCLGVCSFICVNAISLMYDCSEKSNGRLGLQRFPKTTLHDVPFPTRLNIPNARIVSLAAGGM